jgi:hypothetical protein
MDTIYSKIPGHTKEAIDAYVETGAPLGGFLTAVVENDFMKAVVRADDENFPHLKAIAKYLYNRVPSAAFGSPENVSKWREAMERKAVQDAG